MTLTADVLREFPNRVFVETGTHEGGGVALALSLGFSDVRSIESDPRLYARASERFHGESRVKLFFGDSGSGHLWDVIQDIQEPATFWLDAHAIGIVCRSPLLSELAAIARHAVRTHTILIDDRRLFQNRWLLEEQAIRDQISRINPMYRFVTKPSSGGPEDILVAKCDAS